jgi:hypothetical protein
MPKLLIPLIGLVMASAAVLPLPRAEANVSPPAPGLSGAMSALEPARAATACERRRVCRPGAGCAWRTVCKRLPGKAPPRTMSPGGMM